MLNAVYYLVLTSSKCLQALQKVLTHLTHFSCVNVVVYSINIFASWVNLNVSDSLHDSCVILGTWLSNILTECD